MDAGSIVDGESAILLHFEAPGNPQVPSISAGNSEGIRNIGELANFIASQRS